MSFSFKQLFQKESEEQAARGGLQFGQQQAPQSQGAPPEGRAAPMPDPEGLPAQEMFEQAAPAVQAQPAMAEASQAASPFEMAGQAPASGDAPSPFAEVAQSPFGDAASVPAQPSPFAQDAPSPFAEAPAPGPAPEVAAVPPEAASPFSDASASPFAEATPGGDIGSSASSSFFEPVPPSAREQQFDAGESFPPVPTPVDENADKGFVPLSSLPPTQQPAPDMVPPAQVSANFSANVPLQAQNPFAAPAAGEPIDSPFAAPAAQAPQSELPPFDAAPASPASPFGVAPEDAAPAMPPPLPPDGGADDFDPSHEPLETLKGLKAPGFGEALTFSAPAPAPEIVVAEPLPEVVDLPLLAVLADISEASLGFDPQKIPVDIDVSIATASFASQWGNGAVEIGLSDVVSGVEEQFRAAFVNADISLRVPLPMAELAAKLPSPAPAPMEPTPESAPTPMFEEIAPIESAAAPELSNAFEMPAASPAAEASPFGMEEAAPAAFEFPQTDPAAVPSFAMPEPAAAPAPGGAPAPPPPESEPFQPVASMSPFESPIDSAAVAAEPPSAFTSPLSAEPAPQLSAELPAFGEPPAAFGEQAPAFGGQPLASPSTASPFSSEPGQPAFDALVQPTAEPVPEPAASVDGSWPFGEMDSMAAAPASPAAPEPLESLSPLSDQLAADPMAPVSMGSAELSPSTTDSSAGSPMPFADAAPPISVAAAAPLAALAEPPAEAAPSPFAGSQFNDAPEQSTLRALFMAEGKLDAAAVIAHCCEMNGVIECVAVSSDGSLKASSAPAGSMFDDAAALVQSVRALAGSLGADATGPLTLRSPKGLISFFTAGESALGVLHGEEGFQPGVQERLRMVAAELPSLL
jgi:hypothetical protein